ncbi:MAG TPA: hypothetical protein VFA20_27855 [Myxococcaceae bacterium]|nr:hypothetical protein [Myxococcaceae bacterium]
MPRLLETYEEARLLLEAKGWGVSKAADHLFALPGLAGFNLSSSSFSRKTAPGSKFTIEPEVAAAVEGLETRVGFERQTEIIIRGLLALHGDPPIVDVDRLATELQERLPASEFALKLVEALEEKSGQRLTRLSQKLAERSASELTPKLVEAVGALAPKVVEAVEALEERASQRAARFFQQFAERFSRASWKQIAISAGSGALVGCLALAVAPLLPGRANAAPPGPLMVMVFGPGADDAPVRFDPGSLFPTPARWGEKPLDQAVPKFTLPGQKVAPCDAEFGQVAINGNCWANQGDVKPPCGRLFRHGDKCYAPVAADPKKPVGPAP